MQAFDIAYFMVSVDDAETNTRFATEHGADFPILADPTKQTANAYGVIPADRPPDRQMASRWTFYVGPDGKILFIDKAVKAADAGAGIVSKLTELGVKKKGAGL